jgi:hypothetical protein
MMFGIHPPFPKTETRLCPLPHDDLPLSRE